MSKARDIASAAPAPSTVSATEIGYLDGVTSAIQTQINTKAASSTAVTLTGTETLTNKTLTGPIFVSPNETTIYSTGYYTASVMSENLKNSASFIYYTGNNTGNWTLNLRGDSTTTLNSIMNVSDSKTVSLALTNGSTAYYQTALQIDGTTSGVTVKWSGGTAPTAGNANSIDIYTFTVIKTASATYTVLAAGPIKYA